MSTATLIEATACQYQARDVSHMAASALIVLSTKSAATNGHRLLDFPGRDAEAGGPIDLIAGDQRSGDIVAISFPFLGRMGWRHAIAVAVEQHVALPPSIRLLASEFHASSPDQSVHSRFLVSSGHAFMAPVLLNVTQLRHGAPKATAIRVIVRPALTASSRQRCSRPSSRSGFGSSFLRG